MDMNAVIHIMIVIKDSVIKILDNDENKKKFFSYQKTNKMRNFIRNDRYISRTT